jgi:hypothetical protein
MTSPQLQKTILDKIQGLSQEALMEVLAYAEKLNKGSKKETKNTLNQVLYDLGSQETKHLEEEFIDYRKKYPHV